jgi:ferredoxin
MEKPKASIHQNYCLSCGGCVSVCPQNAITMIAKKARINKPECISCGICLNTCPVGAIEWEENS